MDDDLYHKKLTEGLKQLAASDGPEAIIPVMVITVDADQFTCDCVTDDDIEIPGVLYKNINGGEIDVVMQPAQNSRIYIGMVSGSDEWIMIKPGAVDMVHILIGDTELKLTASGIEMNGGDLGGLVKRDGVRQQLNKLENDLNTLKKLFLSWIPVPSDGGAALKANVGNWALQNLRPTQNNDIENINVKQ